MTIIDQIAELRAQAMALGVKEKSQIKMSPRVYKQLKREIKELNPPTVTSDGKDTRIFGMKVIVE